MYSWMAVATFILFKDESLEKTSWTFWFMMQIAMLLGFMVSYPVNAWLIKSGIKKECNFRLLEKHQKDDGLLVKYLCICRYTSP